MFFWNFSGVAIGILNIHRTKITNRTLVILATHKIENFLLKEREIARRNIKRDPVDRLIAHVPDI